MPLTMIGCEIRAKVAVEAPEGAEVEMIDCKVVSPLADDWMRVAPGTDAAIWRPWSRETGEL